MSKKNGKKVRIGIVGLGYFGPILLKNFSAAPSCLVVRGCDKQEALCNRYAREYPETSFTTSYKDLIVDKTLDAIVIATLAESHYELAKQALLAGKHVLIEKPMTTTVKEAEELVEIARKKKLLCMVDHTYIYTGAIHKIRELIKSKKLGTPYHVHSDRTSPGLLRQHRDVIWDLVPHDISILLHLFPDMKPISVMATGASFVQKRVLEIANVLIRFDSDLVASIAVSWLTPVKIRRITITGSSSMIMFDDVEPSEKVKMHDSGVSLNSSNMTPPQPIYQSGDVLIPKLDTTEPLKNEVLHFIKCVQGKEKPLVTGRDGINVVRILEACDKSIAEGREIVLA